MTDGSVQCWGDNTNGQLGNGTTAGSTTPVTVSGIGDATQLGLGIFHTCARRATGTVWCWGLNSHYQLGVSPVSFTTPTPSPVASEAIDAVELGTGTYHNCVRTLAGEFACWGRGTAGALGTGGTTSTPTPVPITFP